jgi:predicted Fe-Mo cluster-binding NifX family protein
MKIAFASSGFSEYSYLSQSLGECPNFIIYDLNDKTFGSIENRYRNSDKSKGPKAIRMLKEYQVDAVITYHIGRNAFNEAKLGGINVYLSPELDMITNVLNKYLSKELQLVESFDLLENH